MPEYNDDYTPYKKKSTKKPPAKAKHKHVFEPCVLEYPRERYDYGGPHGKYTEIACRIDGDCPVCGKIGPIDQTPYWREGERYYSFHFLFGEEYLSDLGRKELDPKTRTLPTFKIQNSWRDKFVTLEPSEEE